MRLALMPTVLVLVSMYTTLPTAERNYLNFLSSISSHCTPSGHERHQVITDSSMCSNCHML